MNERAALGGLGGYGPGIMDLVELAKKTTWNGRPAIEDPGVRQRLADFYVKLKGIEYTGFRFLLFFMAEFATAFAFAALAAILFLQGWWFFGFDVDSDWLNLFGPIVLITKIMLLAFLIFWVRFSVPRFREDQLQQLAWKVLIPLTLLNIVVTGMFKVAF